jgi:hypothetical protein
MEKENNIFKVGDSVFDIQFGWGEVVFIEGGLVYPVSVSFKKTNERYMIDGKHNERNLFPSLSFTAYENKGFSQERPQELPEKGELIMVSNDNVSWRLLEFVDEERRGDLKRIFCKIPRVNMHDYYTYFKRLKQD